MGNMELSFVGGFLMLYKPIATELTAHFLHLRGTDDPDFARGLEKVVGLTGFVIIHAFIASFSPAQGERNQVVNAKFTRPFNEMPMSSTRLLTILIASRRSLSHLRWKKGF